MSIEVKNIIIGEQLLIIMLCVSILLLLLNGFAYYMYKKIPLFFKICSILLCVSIVIYLILLLIYKNIDNYLHYIDQNIVTQTTAIFNRIKEKVKDQKTLPKKLFQTHYDKNLIPQKVKDNIKQYASDYEYRLLDDKDAIRFLKEEYGQLLVDTFNSIKGGAHRADLLRYCLLYRYGGVYVDIKMEFIKPLNEIFTQDNVLYIPKSTLEFGGCYQGLIATPPCNNIFIELINHLISIDKQMLNHYYLVSCEHFYKLIENQIGIKSVKSGSYITPTYNIILFQEHSDCRLYTDLEPDRYGWCSKILDVNGNPIMNTRYDDYPWQ